MQPTADASSNGPPSAFSGASPDASSGASLGAGADAEADVLVASLAERLTALTFAGRSADEVSQLMLDEIVAWGRDRGWRVYRRAASVAKLPPPMDKQHSYVDVAFARPDGRPVVIEVDHTDRRRTVDKLLEESAAGRVAIWVRWSSRAIAAPPDPVRLVAVPVTSNRGLHSRRPDLPVPSHSSTDLADAEQPDLF
ncbi:hypothetical protein AB0H43_10465 [Hamadaea sp. NPDC050747]|uniref:hypothetical protein n=1 Tax=Hamadaea sp. NPDC050747 TaxID=3155789 RepID=UPI0033FF7193